MSYDQASVLAAYHHHGSVRGACAATGCPPYIAYIWLQKAGALTLADKSSYGCENAKLGAAAEKEFQRLVPKAMPANDVLRANCPAFDFDVGGVLVDVKYSSGRSGMWTWRMAGYKEIRPDFFAVFLATAQSGRLDDGYRLLLLPEELFAEHKSGKISQGNTSSPFWDFECQPGELASVLGMSACTAG